MGLNVFTARSYLNQSFVTNASALAEDSLDAVFAIVADVEKFLAEYDNELMHDYSGAVDAIVNVVADIMGDMLKYDRKIDVYALLRNSSNVMTAIGWRKYNWNCSTHGGLYANFDDGEIWARSEDHAEQLARTEFYLAVEKVNEALKHLPYEIYTDDPEFKITAL